jgi:hypothetical protein
VLVLTGPLVLIGQVRSFDASNLRKPVDLAEGWLVQAQDNPDFAKPDFDDLSWPQFNAQTGDLQDVFGRTRPEIVWYRLHLRIAPDQRDLALNTTSLANVIEIYVNGLPVQTVGSFMPLKPYDNSGHLLISIPNSLLNKGSLVIAMRIHIDKRRWEYPRPGYISYQLTFGQIDALSEHMWYWIYGPEMLTWLDYLLNLALTLGALLLYSTQRDRPEYLWLFLSGLVAFPGDILQILALRHTFPSAWHFLDVINAASVYFAARMYCTFAGHKLGWKLNTFLAFLCVDQAYFTWRFQLNVPSIKETIFIFGLSTALNLCILPSILVRDVRRGNRATGLLLVPLVLAGEWTAIIFSLTTLSLIPSLHSWAWNIENKVTASIFGSLVLRYSTLLDIVSGFSLALVILIRSNQISRRQAFLETELANAREIQQIMLPESLPAVPGYRLDCAYEPALQVGGDFFQVVPLDDRRMLIITGDVTGKGLSAAMLVSVLIGAIRSIASSCQTPSDLLRHLNHQMTGKANNGFATAIAAVFDRHGAVTIANAGHLPPYLDGNEVELPGALPLGINDGTHYETAQIQLSAGSRLTFYSDGIIEAQNKNGQLLGFDRGRELSVQDAKAIVDAAKGFGQQDDMTVIIVERLAASEIQTIPQSIPVPATACHGT